MDYGTIYAAVKAAVNMTLGDLLSPGEFPSMSPWGPLEGWMRTPYSEVPMVPEGYGVYSSPGGPLTFSDYPWFPLGHHNRPEDFGRGFIDRLGVGYSGPPIGPRPRRLGPPPGAFPGPVPPMRPPIAAPFGQGGMNIRGYYRGPGGMIQE